MSGRQGMCIPMLFKRKEKAMKKLQLSTTISLISLPGNQYEVSHDSKLNTFKFKRLYYLIPICVGGRATQQRQRFAPFGCALQLPLQKSNLSMYR